MFMITTHCVILRVCGVCTHPCKHYACTLLGERGNEGMVMYMYVIMN